VDVPATDLYDSKRCLRLSKGELILSDGWPDSYQEHKLSNHVAATQLPEGVVVVYCRALRERARDKHYHAEKNNGYKEPVVDAVI